MIECLWTRDVPRVGWAGWRSFFFAILFVVLVGPAVSSPVYPLKISTNNPHLLVDQNNAPYLLQGDGAWGLMVGLKQADVETYLEDRQAKGFNTLVVMAIADHATINNHGTTNAYGQQPFTVLYDFTKPNEAYWTNVDWVIDRAGQLGMQVVLAPCYVGYDATQGWQSWMVSNGVSNCRAYGQFLGQRYGSKANIIWLEDGDNGDSTFFPYVEAIAAGIGDYDTSHLQTAKLWAEESVPDVLSGQSWLGLNTTYAYGFDGWLYQRRVYDVALACYNRTPVMATFLVESTYEDASYGSPPAPTGTAYMVRRQAYWAVLSGGCGQVSGEWYVWPFLTGWQASLNYPGAVAMSYLNGLFGSRAWYAMVPDQSHSVVTSGYGTFGQDDYVTAEWATNGSTLIAYVPTQRTLSVDMTKLGGAAVAHWFDPAGGMYQLIAGSPFTNSGTQTFTPPGNNSAGDGDWVLVLETNPLPAAPQLRIFLPQAFTLQQDPNLNSTNWTDVTNGVQAAGLAYQYWVSTTTGNGFYRLKSTQGVAPPALSISPGSSNTAAVSWPMAAVLAWPTSSAAFRLQQTSNAGTNSWANSTNATRVLGAEEQTTVPILGARQFYRLIYP
jgi:hypothetical protein